MKENEVSEKYGTPLSILSSNESIRMREKSKRKKIFEKIMAEDVPNMMKKH